MLKGEKTLGKSLSCLFNERGLIRHARPQIEPQCQGKREGGGYKLRYKEKKILLKPECAKTQWLKTSRSKRIGGKTSKSEYKRGQNS